MSEKVVKQKAKKPVKAVKNEAIIFDAEGCVMGRLGAFVAKQALGGKNVIIFNAEKALVSGKPVSVMEDIKDKFDAKSRANPWKLGPHRSKSADRFVRRVIRGMLPWHKAKGKAAYKRIMVYMGKPQREIMKREHIDIAKAQLSDTKGFKAHFDYYTTVAEISGYLGGKSK